VRLVEDGRRPGAGQPTVRQYVWLDPGQRRGRDQAARRRRQALDVDAPDLEALSFYGLRRTVVRIVRD
jgi:hypothetical protein